MRAKHRRSKRCKGASIHANACPLLDMPVEVLYLVLGLLDSNDLVKLLHSSKAMAVVVMQHTAGKLTFTMKVGEGAKLTAIRQLLWAPPTAKIKLRLVPAGYRQYGECSDTDPELKNVLDSVCKALPPPCQQPPQLPCIKEACIQTFKLMSLMPEPLTTLLPNLTLLHLRYCTLQDSTCNKVSKSRKTSNENSSGPGRSSRSSRSSSSIRTGAVAVTPLDTLVLEGVDASCLLCSLDSGTKLTRRKQQATEQLQHSLRNVTRLDFRYSYQADHLVPMFDAQLQKLSIMTWWNTPESCWDWWKTGAHLQQLQNLALPNTQIKESDMNKLMSLPSLTHVEVESVYGPLTEDYSNRPCKWQSRQLYLTTRYLHIDTLAKLPLHSLTGPLKLGYLSECSNKGKVVVSLRLPAKDEDGRAMLERLAQQLRKGGVQVLVPQIVWACGSGPGFHASSDLALDAWNAHAIEMIAPAFGLKACVSLMDMHVSQPIVQALATVYGCKLSQLVLDGCDMPVDMQPLWPSVLSGLPALNKLQLVRCWFEATIVEDLKQRIMASYGRQLAKVMAEQPEGRHVELMPDGSWLKMRPQAFAKLVMCDAFAVLAEVQVTEKYGYKTASLRITSMRSY